jgi:hypothetical protein
MGSCQWCLHDIFVMVQGKPYDRNALGLYMDGHILITCGASLLIAYSGLTTESTWAFYVAGIACLSLLIYCMMIFPFLKSFGTIILNTLLLGVLIFAFMKR